jgi:hypothetical protein
MKGTLNKTAQKVTHIEFYETMTISAALYVCDMRGMRQSDKNIIQVSEMFLTRFSGEKLLTKQ